MRLLFLFSTTFVFAMAPVHAWAENPKVDAEIGVRALMESPESYKSQVQVAGVVSQVVTDSKIFGLIDLEEFKTCQKVTCASLVLPVKWDGNMPEVGQTLSAVGEIQKEGKRFLFKASEVSPKSAD